MIIFPSLYLASPGFSQIVILDILGQIMLYCRKLEYTLEIFSNIADLYPLDVSTPTPHGNEKFLQALPTIPWKTKSPRVVPHLQSGWLIPHCLEIPLHIYLLWCTFRMFWCHKQHSNTYPYTFQFVAISDLVESFLEVRILGQRLWILNFDSLGLLSQVAPSLL